jgi:hypothetical protein
MKQAWAFIFFLCYVTLSWFLPEFHPFSRYPMYDSFPNYSYSFYISDSTGQLLPYARYFKVRANEIGHMYCEVFDEHQWARGMGIESDSQLRAAGSELMKSIISSQKIPLPAGEIRLHRLYYKFQNDSIHCYATQLAASKVE